MSEEQFEPKFFGGPISSVKTLLDMVRQKADFDPWDAMMAAIDIARAAIQVFAPQPSFGPMSAGEVELVENAIPEGDDLAIKVEAGLVQLLPAEDRPEGFSPQFVFPTAFIVKLASVWVMEKSYKYFKEKYENYKDEKDEKDDEPAAE